MDNATLVQKIEAIGTRLDTLTKAGSKSGETPGTLFATPIDHKEEGKWGFARMSDFVLEVIDSGKRKTMSPRLQKVYSTEAVMKAAQGMGALIGSDGGFLAPPTFSNTIFSRVYEDENLISRTDQYTVTGNQMVFPRNAETSRATGSRYGGVSASWRQEGGTVTATKPTFGRLTLNLHKLMAMCVLTDELMADTGVALNQYVERAFSEEIGFVLGDAIVRGNGAGQPVGFLNSACLVSVPKTVAQAANTLSARNVVDMFSRLFAGSVTNSIWLVNQDVTPELFLMTLGTSSVGIVAVYMPPGGLSQAPYGSILGRPVIPVPWCSTLGTQGDIILVDPSHYITMSKGGIDTQSSMHLYFDSDEVAIRTIFRFDGQSWWSAPLTPFQGAANTQSHIVTLDTRA